MCSSMKQDRFACYLPGWEMPKNSSEFLTGRYGFITDYLAEAFHHQLKQTNRYEEVSKRIKLGKAVEGRDEKGIKKTVCAFIKILHPNGAPTDEEFEEYVAYAVECRRRVKEQMNKRKTDDEYARINLSYFNTAGQEVEVFCPESRNATATLEPSRRSIHGGAPVPPLVPAAPAVPAPATPALAGAAAATYSTPQRAAAPLPEAPPVPAEPELTEQHYTIHYGDSGHSYESIVLPYLRGARAITIEDPYIRATHQVQNFVRFCEAAIKAPTVRNITLITSYDETTDLKELATRLDELKQSLLELDVALDVKVNENLHDREIRIDNGWTVKIGRGLDFFQKPDSWFGVGANDISLRRCLETKVDVFR